MRTEGSRPRRAGRRALLAAVLLVGLGAGACGAGSEEATTRRAWWRDELALGSAQIDCIEGYLADELSDEVSTGLRRDGLGGVPQGLRARVSEVVVACTVEPAR